MEQLVSGVLPPKISPFWVERSLERVIPLGRSGAGLAGRGAECRWEFDHNKIKVLMEEI